MGSFFPRRLVSRLLLVITGTVFVASLLMAWTIYGLLETNLLGRFDAQAKTNTQIISGLLKQKFLVLESAISFILGDRGFRDGVFYADVTGDPQKLKDYLTASNSRLGVSVSELLEKGGKVLASTDETFVKGQSPEEIKIIQQAIEGSEPATRLLRRGDNFFIFSTRRFKFDNLPTSIFVLNSWIFLDDNWAAHVSSLIHMDVSLFADRLVSASNLSKQTGKTWEKLSEKMHKDGFVEHKIEKQNHRMYVCPLPVLGFEAPGTLAVGSSMAEIRYIILKAGKLLAAQIGFLTSIMVIFLIWFTSQLTRSFRNLVSSTRSISSKGPEQFTEVKIKLSDPEEIVVLSETINQMARALKDRLLRLSEANLKLEEYSSDRQAILANITSASPFAVVMANNEGVIRVWNEAAQALFGWSPDDMINQKTLSTVLTEEGARETQRFLGRLPNERVVQGEIQGLNKNGISFPAEVTLTDVTSSQGKNLGRVFIYRDLREIRKLEGAVLQAEKMAVVGQLAGSIAHDLNNQLTPVRGYLEMILSELDTNNPIRPMLIETNQAAMRSVEIVQRLLNFSKPSAQNKKLVDVKLLMSEIKKMLPQFVPATIETHVRVDPDLWKIYGNETELQTVIVNLIVNARDAMPSGGRMSIRAENTHAGGVTVSRGVLVLPHVVVSIVDSGSGMAPEVMKRIFEPFFSTKGREKGTGLGLSMAHSIVKAHEGWIDISSEVGKGSSFQFYLPAVDSQEEADNKTAAASDEGADLPKGQGLVLFVDDEDRIRTMGKTFLEKLGYSVLLAKDGSDAVEKYVENQAKIVAVVSDMTMPRMSGGQMLLEILGTNPNAKVILASGYTEEGTHDDLIKKGAADFIQKPYRIQQLAKSLHHHTSGQSSP